MRMIIASILESRVNKHFCKMPSSKYFGFVGPTVFTATTPLYSVKAARDDTYMNRHAYVPIKVY